MLPIFVCCMQIRKEYYEEKISAGPQSRILEGVTWEEAQKAKVRHSYQAMQKAKVTCTFIKQGWKTGSRLGVGMKCSDNSVPLHSKQSQWFAVIVFMTWDLVSISLPAQDGHVSGTGDSVIVVGAASKGIIQRDHQHNATIYKTYYAPNPFDNMTPEEIELYKKEVEKKEKGGAGIARHSLRTQQLTDCLAQA